MKIIVEYNGKIYEGKEYPEKSLEEGFQSIYNAFDQASKMTFALSDGSQIILGKEVIQKAVFRVVP